MIDDSNICETKNVAPISTFSRCSPPGREGKQVKTLQCIHAYSSQMCVRVRIAQPAREWNVMLDVDIASRRCGYERGG